MRAPDLAVALAAVEVAAGGLVERRRVALREGQRPEGVEVVAALLDLGHPRERPHRQPVLDDLARRHERVGVHREHADAFERHGPREDPGGAQDEVPHVRAPMKQRREVVTYALRRHSRHASDCGTRASRAYVDASSVMKSAARQASAETGPLRLPETMIGSTEASTTRRFSTPRTRNRESTTSSS
jgi:hypothetical protein